MPAVTVSALLLFSCLWTWTVTATCNLKASAESFHTPTWLRAIRGAYTLERSKEYIAKPEAAGPGPTSAPDGAETPATLASGTPFSKRILASDAVSIAGNCLTSTDAAYPYGVQLESGYKMWWAVNNATRTLTAKLRYSGDAWVGWGPSPDGLMVGSTVVIGLPGQGVYEYFLEAESLSGVKRAQMQELTEVSVTQGGGVTTVEFTRPLQPKEAGKLPTPATGKFHAVYAHGSINALSQHPASAAHGLLLDLTSCSVRATSPSYTLRNVHGWLMACSFGFLLPVGAITARFGRRLGKGWWFLAHRTIQTLGLLGGLAGIGVAVAMVDKDYGGDHSKYGHNKSGFALGCLVVVQVAVALVRPHKVDTSSVAPAQPTDAAPFATVLSDDDEIGQEEKGNSAVAERYKSKSQKPVKQPKIRVAWEWIHFGVGWFVVVWSVVQVYSGLRLIHDQISYSYKWGYTGVVVALAAIAVLLQLLLILRKMSSRRE